MRDNRDHTSTVAQLDSASVFGTEGCRFESCRVYYVNSYSSFSPCFAGFAEPEIRSDSPGFGQFVPFSVPGFADDFCFAPVGLVASCATSNLVPPSPFLDDQVVPHGDVGRVADPLAGLG